MNRWSGRTCGIIGAIRAHGAHLCHWISHGYVVGRSWLQRRHLRVGVHFRKTRVSPGLLRLEKISTVGTTLAVGRVSRIAWILRIKNRRRQHGRFIKRRGTRTRIGSSHGHTVHGHARSTQLRRILSVMARRHPGKSKNSENI